MNPQFETLYELAQKELGAHRCTTYSQAICLEVDQSYHAVFLPDVTDRGEAKAVFAKFLSTLDPLGKLTRVICLWKSGGLDVPSFDCRSALFDYFFSADEAEIMLQGKDEYCVRLLKETV